MARGDFRFEGVVRLTRMGGGYLVFTLIVGFAALNTGNNSLYITLAFMLGALILSGVASKSGLEHISVEVAEMQEAWAGKPAKGLLRLHNRSRMWRVRDVVVTSDELAAPGVLPAISPRKEAFLPVTFLFDKRGRVTFKHIDLYTRYPFGLFVKKRRSRLSGDAIVYPRLISREPDPRRFLAATGQIAPQQRVGLGNEIFAFREYSIGDSLRHVHWRRSASLGRWVIKQHTHEAGRMVEVVVDPVLPPGIDEEAFESLVSEAATLVNEGFDQGLEVQLILPGRRYLGRDPRSRRSMFEALALLEPEDRGRMPDHGPAAIVLTLRGHAETKSA